MRNFINRLRLAHAQRCQTKAWDNFHENNGGLKLLLEAARADRKVMDAWERIQPLGLS